MAGIDTCDQSVLKAAYKTHTHNQGTEGLVQEVAWWKQGHYEGNKSVNWHSGCGIGAQTAE